MLCTRAYTNQLEIKLNLHEQESTLLGARSLKDERHSSNGQRLTVDKLDFADKAVHVEIQNQVSIVWVAFVTVDVITDASPALLSNTSLTYMYKQRHQSLKVKDGV